MAKKLKDEAKKNAGINKQVLTTLISRCDSEKASMDEARGELGSIIKTAEDNHGLNRKAFKLCLSMKRMEEDKLRDFLRSFDDYREKLGFNDQIDLFDEGGDEEARRAGQADEAAASDRAAENAQKLGSGISQLQ